MLQDLLMIGIDEAGRGPVIGPLVFCGYTVRADKVGALKKRGVRDSKELSIGKMFELAPELESIAARIFYKEVHPKVIDGKNLGAITLEAFAEFINSSDADEAFIDVPASGNNVEKYVNRLYRMIDVPIKITGANKADKKFPCVSAASICAKVRREQRIAELKKKYGDFGSGYPHDEKTRDFIKQLCIKGSFPEFVRRKWQTLAKIEFSLKQEQFEF
ncbi:MAG TPA: ribonuclease HII [bacterium]